MEVIVSGLDPHGVTEWRVEEEAVSQDRDLTAGAVTQLSMRGFGEFNPLGKRGTDVALYTEPYGRVMGRVVAASRGSDGWSIEANALMHELAVEADVPPATNQTLRQVVEHYYKAATGEARSPFQIWYPGSLSNARFNVPASKGSAWQALKRFLSANELDVNWVHNVLHVSRMSEAPMKDLRDVTSSWTIEERDHEITDQVSCYVYHREHTRTPGGNGLYDLVYPPRKTFYPDSGKNMTQQDFDPPVITVGARETVEQVLQLDVELTTVLPPTHVDSIDVTKTPQQQDNFGIYAVVGSDNRPVTRGLWRAFGGSVQVKIDPEDRTKVIVTVKGANLPWLAPFRLAESDGEKDYAALYLIGAGVRVDIEEVRMNTRAKTKGSPVVIDNPAIDTLDKAMRAMYHTADRYGGTEVAMTWSGVDPVRSPSDIPLLTFPGFPLEDRNKKRQVFGRVAGHRFRGHDRIWRATTASIGPEGVDMTLEVGDTLRDINTHWGLPRDAEPRMRGKQLRDISGERLNAF